MNEEVVETEKVEKVILEFDPQNLEFTDFSKAQPELNRAILVWSNMGAFCPNFFVSFRDNLGNYTTPDNTKQWALNAWAYLEVPKVRR